MSYKLIDIYTKFIDNTKDKKLIDFDYKYLLECKKNKSFINSNINTIINNYPIKYAHYFIFNILGYIDDKNKINKSKFKDLYLIYQPLSLFDELFTNNNNELFELSYLSFYKHSLNSIDNFTYNIIQQTYGILLVIYISLFDLNNKWQKLIDICKTKYPILEPYNIINLSKQNIDIDTILNKNNNIWLFRDKVFNKYINTVNINEDYNKLFTYIITDINTLLKSLKNKSLMIEFYKYEYGNENFQSIIGKYNYNVYYYNINNYTINNSKIDIYSKTIQNIEYEKTNNIINNTNITEFNIIEQDKEIDDLINAYYKV